MNELDEQIAYLNENGHDLLWDQVVEQADGMEHIDFDYNEYDWLESLK